VPHVTFRLSPASLSRRRLLRASVYLGVSTIAIGIAPRLRAAGVAGTAGAAPKRLALRNLHTSEALELEFSRDGLYCDDCLTQFNHLLRDFRNNEQRAIDPALFDYLFDAAQAAGVDPVFEVISGYRSAATNAALRRHSDGVARNSLHLQGRAIDIRLVGVDCSRLAQCALDMQRGGVGYYHAADFVHLDTGAVRTWRG
jgi:uncharacterized protein YcbK (DUF882 family)